MSGIMVMSCAPQQKKPVYPETAKVDTVDVYFGTQVPDPTDGWKMIPAQLPPLG